MFLNYSQEQRFYFKNLKFLLALCRYNFKYKYVYKCIPVYIFITYVSRFLTLYNSYACMYKVL